MNLGRRLAAYLCGPLAWLALALPPRAAFADTVTIGAEDDAAPWSYADGSGYVNDLVRKAYQAVGWEVNYEVLPYPRCKQMAEDGKLAACFSASNTPETAKLLQFPKLPVFDARNVLIVNTASPLQGCDPKAWGRKLSVGFVNEYEYVPKVEKMLGSGLVEPQKTTSEVLAVRMLQRERFDAVVVTLDPVKRLEMLAAQAEVPQNFKVICDFGGLPAYVAFSRRHPQGEAALAAFNKGLKLINKNGTTARLRKEWAGKALSAVSAKRH